MPKKGSTRNAISHFDETIRLNPNVISAYKNRGTAKAELGRHEEAIADYDVSLGLRPRDAEAHITIGETPSLNLAGPKLRLTTLARPLA